ncbi:hypothetical protein GM160_09975 [Guyparkeria halophila]|uniref:HNH endonuclease n=1 Tax=Guyparkeria halophila TaxID=47960 RepID=A0A6I6D2Y0_9GAMM|nr:hypothetical protein [Guyparkeria halophila]QGT79188.1 hypothetical protein GM160_09975 [Guyparkeria halophila]
MIWCPYTDKEISPDDASREHIIPLSLGGLDGFEIPVDKEFNSRVGAKLDGALANDFLVALSRNAHDIRGHSKRRPVVTVKKSADADTGSPLQVTFDQAGGLKMWCPINNKYVEEPGKKLSSQVNISTDIDISFVAKVALSAGYFAYGECFQGCVRHDELRLMMNNTPRDLEAKNANIDTLVDGRFSSNSADELKIFRLLCKAVSPASIVGLVPSPGRLGVFVGILGSYMGMVNVPAVVDDFPNEGVYDLGHVICPQNGDLVRVSFRRALQKLVGDV